MRSDYCWRHATPLSDQGTMLPYSWSRASLKRGLKRAKHSRMIRIEENFSNNSEPWRMWQGIQAVTDQLTPAPQPVTPSFLMSLTTFISTLRVTTRRWPARLYSLQADSTTLTLFPTDVCAALSIRLLALMASLNACSGPVLNSWLRSWLASSTSHWPKQLSPHASKPPPSCWSSNRKTCVRMPFDPHRATCWVLSSTPSSPTTAHLYMVPVPILSLQMTQQWLASSTTKNESANGEEVQHLVAWCADNNLTFNSKKTKELIMDLWHRYRCTRVCQSVPLPSTMKAGTLRRHDERARTRVGWGTCRSLTYWDVGLVWPECLSKREQFTSSNVNVISVKLHRWAPVFNSNRIILSSRVSMLTGRLKSLSLLSAEIR